MFLDSRLRLSELAGLKAADVHIEDQYVRVMGKGAKERMVAFGNTALAMVDRYVHLATSKVALLSRGYSPLDKLGIRSLRRGGNGNRNNHRDRVQVFQRH